MCRLNKKLSKYKKGEMNLKCAEEGGWNVQEKSLMAVAS